MKRDVIYWYRSGAGKLNRNDFGRIV